MTLARTTTQTTQGLLSILGDLSHHLQLAYHFRSACVFYCCLRNFFSLFLDFSSAFELLPQQRSAHSRLELGDRNELDLLYQRLSRSATEKNASNSRLYHDSGSLFLHKSVERRSKAVRPPHALHFFGGSFLLLCALQGVPLSALLPQLLAVFSFLDLALLRLSLLSDRIQVSVRRQAEGSEVRWQCDARFLCALLLLAFQLGVQVSVVGIARVLPDSLTSACVVICRQTQSVAMLIW